MSPLTEMEVGINLPLNDTLLNETPEDLPSSQISSLIKVCDE